jgi:hypothetical protein
VVISAIHEQDALNGFLYTVKYGPLTTARLPSWLEKNQTRNYVVKRGDHKARDMLLLWLGDEEKDVVANIYWVRAK